ncbi:MAG: NADH-quinone oxidoreductase subunit NuoE [bacterium]|nr:NADH-quinone oxidoreductase subunit NuoE [bacterium]
MKNKKKSEGKIKSKDKCGCAVSCESEEIIKGFSHQGKQYVIPLLQKVQEQDGYISEETMDLVSEKLGVPVSQVYAITTFYSYFRLQPIGKHLVRPCRGTACHVKGSKRIIEKIKEHLDLKGDIDTTADNQFTVAPVACLGTCGLAPVMMIGNNVYGNLNEENAGKIIDRLKS